jgi:CheY-like chemotaxis protein
MRAIETEIVGPDGRAVVYLAPTRNISRDGASILLSHYVYRDTEVRLRLMTLSRRMHVVAAKVVHCRYIAGTGSVHEVGLRFTRPVDVSVYYRGARSIHVLLIDNDDAVPELVRRLLKTYTLDLSYAETTAVGCDLAREASFDLALADVDRQVRAEQIVKGLRDVGYRNPIVAMTAHTSPEARQRCFDAGFDRFVAKPLTSTTLSQTVESCLNEPLVSAYADDPNLADLISRFVADLPQQVAQLEQALHGNDLARFEALVRTLKGQAGSYGFDVITQVAAWLEMSVQQGSDPGLIEKQFSELARWCESAQSAPE